MVSSRGYYDYDDERESIGISYGQQRDRRNDAYWSGHGSMRKSSRDEFMEGSSRNREYSRNYDEYDDEIDYSSKRTSRALRTQKYSERNKSPSPSDPIFDEIDTVIRNTTPSRSRMSRQSPSNRQPIETGSHIINDLVADANLRQDDTAFESLALPLVAYFGAKVADGSTSYFVDYEDFEYLKATIPTELRQKFVTAARYRARYLSPEAEPKESKLVHLTRECVRLGFTREFQDNFMIGGGFKAVDGTITVSNVTPASSNKKISKRKKKSSPLPSGMEWLAESGLPPDQMECVIAAMQLHGDEANIDNLMNNMSTNQKNISSHPAIPPGFSFLEEAGLTEEQIQVAIMAMRSTDQNNPTTDEVKSRNTSKTDRERQSFSKDEFKNSKRSNGVSESTGTPTLNAPLNLSGPFWESSEMIEIVAPRDLTEDDDFETEVYFRKICVDAPIGGARSGQKFFVPADEVTLILQVPDLKWRDSIFAFFTNGLTSAFSYVSLLFPLYALGQVMSRVQLNFLGSPCSQFESYQVHYNHCAMIFVWIMLNAAIFAAVEKAGSISDIDMYLFLGTNITFYLICVFITGNARRSIRNKYSIQGSFASDIFTSLFAMPLVVSQLGRHTVDCKLYSYKLWSRKGMYGDVEFTSKLENERKSNYVPPDSIENDDSYGMV